MPKERKSAPRINYAIHAAIIIPIAVMAAVGWAAYNPISGFAAKTPVKRLPKSAAPKPKPLTPPAKPTTVSDGVALPKVQPKNGLVISFIPLDGGLGLIQADGTDRDIFRFHAAPQDASSPIALKQMMFNCYKSPGVAMGYVRLSKDGVEMPLADYSISVVQNSIAYTMENSPSSPAQIQGDNCRIIMSFRKEEMLAGSGHTYAIHTKLSSVGTQSSYLHRSLAVSFTTAPSFGNGYLTNRKHGWFSTTFDSDHIYHIDAMTPPDPARYPWHPGVALWSDLSSPGHSHLTGVAGGSTDWFNTPPAASATGTQRWILL